MEKNERNLIKNLHDLFEKYFLPLPDYKNNIEAAIKKKAVELDKKIAALEISRNTKVDDFAFSSGSFLMLLLSGHYEPDNEESFYKDTRGNRIIKMARQKRLREFGLKLLAHYFSDRLHERKVAITMHLVGMSDNSFETQPVEYVEEVAETDDPVLITGETGTGKELLAQAIHYLSRRKENVFIPINCGGINKETLQSELFGHVKGAFTGAIRDEKGVFQKADRGTLFRVCV